MYGSKVIATCGKRTGYGVWAEVEMGVNGVFRTIRRLAKLRRRWHLIPCLLQIQVFWPKNHEGVWKRLEEQIGEIISYLLKKTFLSR